MDQIEIQRLNPIHATAYRNLRLQALQESPTAYGSTYEKTARRSLADFEAFLKVSPNNWNFGAFQGDEMVGIAQLVRAEGSKEEHKASIYGLFVSPALRRRGIGRQLFERTLETARSLPGLRQINLGVVTTNTPAVALYRASGFVDYGCEKDALHVDEAYYDEALMVLRLV